MTERDWTVHPGEILREKLDEIGMTQSYLAMATGYTQKHINQVVQGHCGISPQMALRLERELDISARMLVRLQADYDLDVARGITPAIASDDKHGPETTRGAEA